MSLSKEYWSNRYKKNDTGWDIGHVSTPIKEYLDQLKDTSLKILFPGVGYGYEPEYAFQLGFKHVFVLDYCKEPLETFQTRVPNFPANQIIQSDFFEHDGNYDIVIEQTLFCALDRNFRMKYMQHCSRLLQEKKGKLVGLLFNKEFEKEGPPFGGTKDEYLEYIHPNFKIQTLEECYNSIPPRKGNELFMILES